MTRIIKLLSVYVIVLALFLPLTGSERDKALEFYRQSLEQYNKKDYNGFLQNTKKALEYLPKNHTLKYNLARGLALTGKTHEALDILEPLVDLGIFPEVDTQKDFNNLKEDKRFQALAAKVKKQKQPLVKSKTAFTLPERDLIPEGITYDKVEKAFYLSSLSKCKIVKVDAQGKITDFVAPRQDGLLPAVGMEVDAKRRVLWACNSFGYPHDSLPRELFGSTGVFKYDLKTRKLIKKYTLPKQEKHFLNDLTITPDGTVYLSDSYVPAVYKIDPKKDEIEKFVDLSGQLFPNGITYSTDTHKIFAATADEVIIVDPQTRKITTLGHAKNQYIAGGDGMYYYKGSLISIQNTVGKGRIVRLTLDEKQEKVTHTKILENQNPDYAIPTTGTIVKNYLYFISNSQLDKFDDKGKLPPIDKLQETKILKLEL
jgi:sugar lactone lactonase YvrE